MVALLLLPQGVLLPEAVRADWLLHHAPCRDRADPPAFAVQYPAHGMPAVVAAGAMLEARVRVPVPLTPPPGRQQAAALLPWSAELSARLPLAFGGADDATGRMQRLVYPLPVVDLRPEDGTSLRYRLRLPVPAWTAPGVYGLQVRGPGGMSRASGAVVVRAASSEVRIAGLPKPGPVGRSPGAHARRLPFDLAVPSGPAPAPPPVPEQGAPGPMPLPLLAPGFSPPGGRSGHRDLWVLKPWSDRPPLAFGLDGPCGPMARSIAEGYGAVVAPMAPTDPPAWASHAPPPVEFGPVVRVHGQPGRVRRARILLPATATGYSVSGTLSARFYPAGEWHGRPPRWLVAVLHLAPDATATLKRSRAAGGATPGGAVPQVQRPLRVVAGERFALSFPRQSQARSASPEVLAVRLSARETHLGTGMPTMQLDSTGPRVISALAIGQQGEVRLLRLRLLVRSGGRPWRNRRGGRE